MSRPRIVTVYSDVERPDTTGGYCLSALQEIADVTHVQGGDLSRLKEGNADLFLRIDDSVSWDWSDHLHPSAYWAIDTHLDYESRLSYARQFDRVFCAQKASAERMCADGLEAEWLPLACDPELHG